jgi:anti-sigma-K factor RskA
VNELHRHDESESVGAYALGALPELEAQVFERHLMRCEQCQDELQRLNEAVEALPRSVTPHEAPASLKTSLMDVVNAEAASRGGAPERARWRPSFRLPRLAPAAAWAAAAVLIVGVLGGYGISQLGSDDESGRTLQAQVDMNQLPDGSASLSVPADEDDGSVLRVEGMPDPGGERVYQVWVQRDGEVVPVSIFNVDGDGDGSAAVPQSLEDGDAVMVTREPRGGSEEPTESPVLRVDV